MAGGAYGVTDDIECACCFAEENQEGRKFTVVFLVKEPWDAEDPILQLDNFILIPPALYRTLRRLL